jgi:diguanylate cyclase
MSTHATSSTPRPAPRSAEPAHPASWFARLSPWWGGALLATLVTAAAAGMAWGLSELLLPMGGTAAPLAAAIGMLVLLLPLSALLLKLARQLERSQDLLGRLDTLDMLTGVANRAHFMALAEREWARARRYGHGAGIVIVEVDRYRRICEVRGTGAGDAVLRELAMVIGRGLRGADALARYSSSQLVVLLAQADPTGALDVAERVREHAEKLEVPWQDHHLRLTVSTGVATLRPAHLQLSALVQDAEAAVDAARHAGGNCVRAAPIEAARSTSRGPSIGDNQAAGPL